jgi:hypothetical protein
MSCVSVFSKERRIPRALLGNAVRRLLYGAFYFSVRLFRKKIYKRTYKIYPFNSMKKLVKCYAWGTAFYGTGTWTFRELDHKSFEMLC